MQSVTPKINRSVIKKQTEKISDLFEKKEIEHQELRTSILSYIEKSDISIRKFGRDTGIRPGYLWEVLQGKRPFSLDTVKKINNWVNK